MTRRAIRASIAPVLATLACLLLAVRPAAQAQPAPAAPASPADAGVEPVEPTPAEPAEPAPVEPANVAAPIAAPAASRTVCTAQQASLSETDESCDKRPPIATDEVPDVASLKAPESPAFMAIGVVPTQIQRPTTPTGLATSLASGVANGGTLALAQNFALEVTPYWLARHPSVTFEQWQDQRGRVWYRNASLSLATGTIEKDAITATGTRATLKSTSAAAGLRTTLWPGNPSKGAVHCREFLTDYAQRRSMQANRFINDLMDEWLTAHPRPTLSLPARPKESDFQTPDGQLDAIAFGKATQDWQRQVHDSPRPGNMTEFTHWAEERDLALGTFEQEFEKAHPAQDSIIERCLADVHARSGPVVDLAGAYAMRVPNADLGQLNQNGAFTGTGWLTAGYIAENLRAADVGRKLEGSALAVFRWQREDAHVAGVAQDLRRFDVGLRLVLAARRYAFAPEATIRKQHVMSKQLKDDDQLLYRVAINLDYRLSGGMWVTGAFGKDFGDTSKQKPLIALANLQWAFGTTRSVSPDSFKTGIAGTK